MLCRYCLNLDPYFSASEAFENWLNEFPDIKKLVAEGMQARGDDGVPSKLVHWYPSGKDDAGPHKPRLCSTEAFKRVRSAFSSSTGLAEMYHKLRTFAEAAQLYEDWVLARLDADDKSGSLVCKVIRARVPEKVDGRKRPIALTLADEHKRPLGPYRTVVFNDIEALHVLILKHSSRGVLYRPANRNLAKPYLVTGHRRPERRHDRFFSRHNLFSRTSEVSPFHTQIHRLPRCSDGAQG